MGLERLARLILFIHHLPLFLTRTLYLPKHAGLQSFFGLTSLRTQPEVLLAARLLEAARVLATYRVC